MKVKEGFILKEIAGSTVAVPAGSSLVNLRVMLTLNESGAFLWNCLKENMSIDGLVEAMTAEYEVDSETARTDVMDFLKLLKENQLLDET